MKKEELIRILETMLFEDIERFRIVFEIDDETRILEFDNGEY